VLRAHGIKPRWAARLKHKGLSSESKNAFRKINLRWHDLRHEYASRLVERGVPLAQVQDRLGHASITTTERYDNQKLENLQIAAAKLESGMNRPRRSSRTPKRAHPGGRRAQGFKNRSSTRVSSLDRAPFARCLQPNLTSWKT